MLGDAYKVTEKEEILQPTDSPGDFLTFSFSPVISFGDVFQTFSKTQEVV